MSKYQEYSLEELITYISRGITPKYTEEVNNSAIIINQKCIRDFQINFEPSRRNNLTQRIISEEKKVKLFDILINSTGVGTLGRVAQFLDDKIKEIISKVLIILIILIASIPSLVIALVTALPWIIFLAILFVICLGLGFIGKIIFISSVFIGVCMLLGAFFRND